MSIFFQKRSSELKILKSVYLPSQMIFVFLQKFNSLVLTDSAKCFKTPLLLILFQSLTNEINAS